MKRIIGGILIVVGAVHALGCVVGKHFPSLIFSALVIGIGIFLIKKPTAKKGI